jgi:Winged helix DNA-binding domain
LITALALPAPVSNVRFMSPEHLARWRMHNLRLAGPPFDRPTDVIGWLGAVQSQDYGPAKWSLGHRTTGLRDSDVDRLLAEGKILRTHVLRPTWHFVLPADIHWMLELTAPRIHQLSSYYYRQLELDDAIQKKCRRIIERALRSEGQLTRKEIQATLERGGIRAQGPRLGYIMMYAELNRLVCSGSLKGRQHTYALLEERAPHANELTRDQGLAELTRRYFTGHGPATINDFKWWSSLTVADIKRGLEMVGRELSSQDIDGTTFWFGEEPPARRPTPPIVNLLQPYDEYLVGYSPETKYVVDATGRARSSPAGTTVPNDLVIINGQVAGFWRRTLGARSVEVEVRLFEPLTRAGSKALAGTVAAHAEFLGLSAELTTTII